MPTTTAVREDIKSTEGIIRKILREGGMINPDIIDPRQISRFAKFVVSINEDTGATNLDESRFRIIIQNNEAAKELWKHLSEI